MSGCQKVLSDKKDTAAVLKLQFPKRETGQNRENEDKRSNRGELGPQSGMVTRIEVEVQPFPFVAAARIIFEQPDSAKTSIDGTIAVKAGPYPRPDENDEL